ncbi:MAG TPA: 6-bladed beta-propeller [Saprospiraceae bacterium]|nr:6-bladed beta-propeller [Saprospiraceae bacterium]
MKATLKKFMLYVILALLSIQNVCLQVSIHKVSVSKQDHSISQIGQLVKSYELIQLEMLKDDFLAEISKVITTSEFIYVLDSELNRLIQFDKQGKYIRQIGKMGEGYDEFRDISDFDVDNVGNIYILSNRNWGYLKYSKQGKFLQKYSSGKTAVSHIGVLDPDFVICGSNHFDEDFHNVLVINKKGQVIKKMHPYPKNRYQMSFGFTGGMTRSGDMILYAEPASCYIHKIKISEGEVFSEKAFEMDLGKNMWKCEDHTDIEAFWNKASALPEDLSYLKQNFRATDQYLFFAYQEYNRIKNGLYSLSSGKLILMDKLTPGLLQNAIKFNPVKGIENQKFLYSIDEELWFYLKRESERIKNTEIIDAQLWKVMKDIRGDGSDPYYLLVVEFH